MQWIYFIHPPREDFIGTITDDEAALMAGPHTEYLSALFDEGTLILAGPTFDCPMHDGIAVIDAGGKDEATAIMNADPAVASGLMTGELRQMHISYLRSTDEPEPEDLAQRLS